MAEGNGEDRRAPKSTKWAFASLLPLPRRLINEKSGPADKDSDAIEQEAERRRHIARLVLLALIFLIGLYYWWPRDQSFLVDVETDILTVTTSNLPSELWEISNPEICWPAEVDSVDSSDSIRPEGFCDAATHGYKKLELAEISWPGRTSLTIRVERTLRNPGNDDGDSGDTGGEGGSGKNAVLELVVDAFESATPLIVEDFDKSATIVPGTIIRFPLSAFETSGVLTLSGAIRLGQTATQNTRRLLRRGRYEVREKLWFRENPILLASGPLTIGEAVEIISADHSNSGEYPVIQTSAFIDAIHRPRAAMRVVMTSRPEPSILRKERARATALVRTTWLQRLAVDPVPIGIATLLSLFGASLAIVQNFIRPKY